MSENTCPKCTKTIFEEMYMGTVSPELCNCEPVRVWDNGRARTVYHRPQNDIAKCGSALYWQHLLSANRLMVDTARERGME